jgi:hypothetical protein
MRIVAVVPSSRAAIATACAWLPDEYATTPSRGLRQRGDLVVCAAELERASALEALRLHVDLRADETVERPGSDDRRAVRDAVEAARRRQHVGELDHRQGFA